MSSFFQLLRNGRQFMNRCFISLSYVFFISILTLLQCTTKQVTGIEVTNGNCVGKIYNEDNTVASGVLVRLIPSGYDPTIPSSGKIDSTFTDKNGEYSFSVTKSDYYNIFAQKDNKFCKKDSVSIISNISQNIGNDTLSAPALLTGKVRVKPENDPLKTVILFYGTNFYTVPYDSSGNFDTVYLPEGQYTVKAFSTEDGYGIFDTSIIVSSGEIINITITIPTFYSPQVFNVKASFDSSNFSASLSWDPVDTSLITYYAVHRIINNVHDTLMQIDKNVTAISDYCGYFVDDTVTYQISAVGKNYKEGYLTTSIQFYVGLNIDIVYKSDLDSFLNGNYILDLSAKEEELYVLISNNAIYKITFDGTVENIISESQAKTLFTSQPFSIDFDSFGNIYVFCRKYTSENSSLTIYKFDSEFNLIASQSVEDGLKCRITTGDNGLIYLQQYFYYSDSTQRKIWVYDQNLDLKKEFFIDINYDIQQCSGNQILAMLTESQIGSKFISIQVYDTATNLISVHDVSYPIKSDYNFSRQYYVSFAKIISDNFCLLYANEKENNHHMIVLANLDGDHLARIELPKELEYKTGSSKRLYCKSKSSNVIYSFSMNQFYLN